MIDGFRFLHLSKESFFDLGRMMSGIEIPAPDQDFHALNFEQ